MKVDVRRVGSRVASAAGALRLPKSKQSVAATPQLALQRTPTRFEHTYTAAHPRAARPDADCGRGTSLSHHASSSPRASGVEDRANMPEK